MPPTLLAVSAATEFQIEAPTSADVKMPLIQQTAVTNYQTNVDLDATFSNNNGEIVPINSEEFTERYNDNKEHAYYNGL